jgi:hypothetical protein
MRQYKARRGEILDADDEKQICVILPSNCTKKMRDKIVKYAVEKLNAEERGKYLAKGQE